MIIDVLLGMAMVLLVIFIVDVLLFIRYGNKENDE
jgi:hypothetical protein